MGRTIRCEEKCNFWVVGIFLLFSDKRYPLCMKQLLQAVKLVLNISDGQE